MWSIHFYGFTSRRGTNYLVSFNSFVRLPLALIYKQFVVSPWYRENLLPNLGSDCHLLPRPGSDLHNRAVQKIEILHIEQVCLRETSSTGISIFEVTAQIGKELASPSLFGMQFDNLLAEFPIKAQCVLIDMHCCLYLALSETLA